MTVAGCCPPPPGSRDPEHGASGGPDLGRPRASGPRVLGGGWRGAVPACPDPAGGRGHLGGPCSTVGITGAVPGAGRAGSCPALLGGAYQNKPLFMVARTTPQRTYRQPAPARLHTDSARLIFFFFTRFQINLLSGQTFSTARIEIKMVCLERASPARK